MKTYRLVFYLSLSLLFGLIVVAQTEDKVRLVPIANGWAKNQINAAIFRRNSVITHKDKQYAAFYDSESRVVLAMRNLSSTNWTIHTTHHTGNTKDAHNSISIAIDGDGFLHVVWNHHSSALQYCRSIKPESLQLSDEMKMTGTEESKVSYPEFYNLPNGKLLFLYRDGVSGGGNLILNEYDVKMKRWKRVQSNLIDGENERNAYWQMAVDKNGRIHLSWTWRETPNVATNHDICYAKSIDGGKTWQKSSGEKYNLPITAKTAEYALRIPQNSELINQTSMFADSNGRPYIATYWRPKGEEVPQYFLVYFDGNRWATSQITDRKTPFSLSGTGTKRIPISRPQLVINSHQYNIKAYVIFRDEERGNRVSVAGCNDLKTSKWTIKDLTKDSVGMWEPTLDSQLWNKDKTLHIFLQKVGQGDNERIEDIPSQMIYILEWKPKL